MTLTVRPESALHGLERPPAVNAVTAGQGPFVVRRPLPARCRLRCRRSSPHAQLQDRQRVACDLTCPNSSGALQTDPDILRWHVAKMWPGDCSGGGLRAQLADRSDPCRVASLVPTSSSSGIATARRRRSARLSDVSQPAFPAPPCGSSRCVVSPVGAPSESVPASTRST
jgi:hypothetical protein